MSTDPKSKIPEALIPELQKRYTELHARKKEERTLMKLVDDVKVRRRRRIRPQSLELVRRLFYYLKFLALEKIL